MQTKESLVTLHPIKALKHVIDEYADYLLTEFRAKDPKLRAALEAELDARGFLAQEPFYQAHRPFKSGTAWRNLPIDARLAQVMENRSKSEAAYLHQAEAIAELLSPAARPVVVTTGTGSGKTEAFLLPVIENAWQDASRFKKPGLTAILVYPMNALANDQEIRINQYLEEAGLAGAITVAKYDRGTSQADRERLRKSPPHILLTNYMMLEHLLVRPADREAIFANHRCRFLVLDEVHTYRGILGSNIALLVRRFMVHLARARHDWKPDVPDEGRAKRYPSLVPVGTSATIKTVAEEGLSYEERIRQRDEAVQEFFGTLVGVEPSSIRVFGEELEEIAIPSEAMYPKKPGSVDIEALDVSNPEAVRQALCRLAGLPGDTPLDQAARRYRLLWDLNRWLIARPMSAGQIVAQMKAEVPERKDASEVQLRAEVEAALTIGAALPEGMSGGLRLRAHRFIRGGWQFHRCINRDCGKLYPMGEEKCSVCHHDTARDPIHSHADPRPDSSLGRSPALGRDRRQCGLPGDTGEPGAGLCRIRPARRICPCLRRRTGGEDGNPAGAVGAPLPDRAGRDPHAGLPVAGDAAVSPGQCPLPRAHPAGRMGTPDEAAAGLPDDARWRTGGVPGEGAACRWTGA